MIKVTICASTKFKSFIEYMNRELTMRGIALYTIHVFHHVDEVCITPSVLNTMRELHFDKISDSDFVLVLSPNNYIGDSTRNEMEYARIMNKHIYTINSDYASKTELDALVDDMTIRYRREKESDMLWH